MARARNIKPGFFKNEDLAECSFAARLCFAGLWTLADRDGRLEDRPKRIKGELFAFDTVDVEPLLQELVRFKFIVRYEVEGMKAIQIPEFARHQAPHYSESKSVIKPPTLPEDSGKEGVIKRGSQPPDSLIPDSLIPSSLNPDSLNPDSQGENPPDPPFSPGVADAPTPPPAPAAAAAPPPKPRKPRKAAGEPPASAATWETYAQAYAERYGVVPVRNAKVNGQLAQLVQRLGADEAPGVARSYLANKNSLYVAAKHCTDLLLRDAEKLRTEWATGEQVTTTQARQQDRTQTNASAFAPLMREAQLREKRHA